MPIITDLTEPVGQIRLEIGDDVEDPEGVRPHGRNFSDAQLTHFYSQEGRHVGRAAAKACEVLARDWAKEPTAVRLGPQGEEINTSAFFRLEADRLRRVYGRNQVTINRPMGSAGVRIYPAGANPADE